MKEKHYPPLNITCHIAASPEQVFDAWTVPAIANLWLFKNDTNTVSLKTDIRVGGVFSVAESSNGETIDHFGEYLEIERPSTLVFSLEVPGHFKGISTVVLAITKNEKGTVLNFTQSGINTSLTKKPWKQMFKVLQALLGGGE